MGNEANRPNPEDVAFAAVYAGAVGSGAIALLFLVLDLIAGQPLSTPSTVGSALFLGIPAGEATTVRMDMIAAFSLVHFTAFAIVGAAFALLLARFTGLQERPLGLGYGLFVVLSTGVILGDQLLPGSVLGSIGIVNVLLGNATAAAAMTWFYVHAFAGESAAAVVQSHARS